MTARRAESESFTFSTTSEDLLDVLLHTEHGLTLSGFYSSMFDPLAWHVDEIRIRPRETMGPRIEFVLVPKLPGPQRPVSDIVGRVNAEHGR